MKLATKIAGDIAIELMKRNDEYVLYGRGQPKLISTEELKELMQEVEKELRRIKISFSFEPRKSKLRAEDALFMSHRCKQI